MATPSPSTPSSPKTILITGTSRGIGYAITLSLLAHPSQPNLILLSRNTSPLQVLQSQYPTRIQYLHADFSTSASTAAAATAAVTLSRTHYGRLDGVILNHGILGPVSRIADPETRVEGWNEALQVNYLSCVEIIHQTLPLLTERQGVILLTSSGAASNAYPAWGCYGASKAALNHLALTVAKEEKDVTCLAIRPGAVDTEMQREIREVHVKKMDEEDGVKFTGLFREGKLVKAEDVGAVMARVVMGLGGEMNSRKGRELSGRFVSWDGVELKEWREG